MNFKILQEKQQFSSEKILWASLFFFQADYYCLYIKHYKRYTETQGNISQSPQ